MSINQRLGLAFVLLLAVVIGFAEHVRRTVSDVRGEFRVFQDTSRQRLENARNLERDVLMAALSLRGYIAFPTDDYRLRMDDAIVSAYESALTLADSVQPLPEISQSLPAIKESLDGYFDVSRQYLAAALAQEPVGELEQRLTLARERMLSRTRTLSAQLEESAKEHLAAVGRELRALVERVGASAVLALILFAVLGLVLARSIRQPIVRMVDAARLWQSGDHQAALALNGSNTASNRPVRGELKVLVDALGKAAEAVQRREQRLATDTLLCRRMMVSLDAAELGVAALRDIVEHLEAAGAVLYRWDEDDQRLRQLAEHRLTAAEPSIAYGEGLPGEAARTRAPSVLNEIPATDMWISLGYDKLLPNHAAAIPVQCGEHLLGVLVVASLRPFDQDSMDFLVSAANLMALGLRNSVNHQKVVALLDEVRIRNSQILHANEELHAHNEKIQTQNEEIQAQHEEIQAQNEEIQAQHDESQAQNLRLSELAEDLRRHAEEIELADRRKTEFLATLAHELRNPMAPISTSVALLRRSCNETEYARTALATIERQSNHLTRLIEDLLDITRISRGKIELQRQPLDLVRLVADCVEDHRPAIADKQLELALECPATELMVNADPDRIAQVIGNLLLNAMKFTPKGGRIEVEVAGDDDGARITVADTGVGIDGDLLSTLFEPFAQGPGGLDRRNGGLGLGLALVKGLVEQHGGTVRGESEGTGKGSRFTVILPRLEDETPTAEVHTASRPPQRILVVDDNADAANTLRMALEWDGYAVCTAHDGTSVITAADEFKPDVILCDIGLPGIDGYEVARRLRALPRHSRVLLVALTGYASAEDRERSRSAGFDLHLAKPVDYERLSESLRQMRVNGSTGTF